MKKFLVLLIFVLSVALFIGCNTANTNMQRADEMPFDEIENNSAQSSGLLTDEPQDVHEHEFNIEVVIEPTETERGCTVHICGCGESYEDNFTAAVGFSLRFLCSDPAAGQITGKTEQRVLSGETSETVVAVPNLGYRFVRWNNGELSAELTVYADKNETYFAIFQIDAYELPVMQINTQQAQSITSKEDYVQCNVSVINADYEYRLVNESAKIRGRGNSTWNMPKKPYKLKFNSKIDLFGNGKAKTWTLIANYCDPSLVRNSMAYAVGALFDELNGYITTTQNVELYVNGEYLGLYTVCEQVEVGKTRVNIAEDIYNDKTESMIEPENVGYLIEMDVRAPEEGDEGWDYFVINGTPYAIKSPDTEDERFSVDYVGYIKTYFETCYAAVCGDEWETVSSLLDVQSFAATYIVHELFNCVDCGQSSVYFYKVQNGKLFSGPLWDFDISSGNCNYCENINSPAFLWAKSINCWYKNLLHFEEFREIVKSQLGNYSDGIISVITAKTQEFYSQSAAFQRNFERWEILGVYVWPNPDEIVEITTWHGQVEHLVSWLTESLNFMITEYCD